MADQKHPDEALAETGKPDDPAKQENPDTRLDQLQPEPDREALPDDRDPALQTTREAGQGTG